MNTYKYEFEKNPKRKGVCPACGEKNQFRYYQDEFGNRMDEQYGICERKNSCGHHSYPTLDHNKMIVKKTSKVNNVRKDAVVSLNYPTDTQCTLFESYLKNTSSNLHQYLLTKGISAEHLEKTGLGTDKYGKTVFIYRDITKKIVNIKTVSYVENGKRDKAINAYSLKQPKDTAKRYSMCLFGEDSIGSDKTVIVVESEKTKIIASFHYPEYDWVACGSANGLTADKAKVLASKKVIWLCDSDVAGRQNSSIENLDKGGFDFKVIDLFPNKTDGYDIADAILSGEKPDLKAALLQTAKQPASFYTLLTSTVKYENATTSISVRTRNNWEVIAENFHIFIKHFTEDDAGSHSWMLQIVDEKGEEQFLEVTHDDFCSAKRLRSILATKQISLKAQDSHWIEVQSALFNKRGFGKVKKINRYGFNSESQAYIFSNKILTADMELLEPNKWKIIYSNGGSFAMPTPNKLTDKRLFLTDFDIDFNKWYSLYEKAHLRSNSFIPACFYVFSLFRDIAVSRNKTSSILYLKGAAGSGKSSIVRQLTCLFGYQQAEINLKSKNTEAALVKLMGQHSNSLIWFDEFHNGFSHEGLLQAAYDNSGYHRSVESNSKHETESLDITSSLALTSNYIPSNPIFFSRCLLIQVEETDKSDDQLCAFEQICKMEENGLGMVTVGLLISRNLIKEQFLNFYSRIHKKLKTSLQEQSIPERMFVNMAQVLTPAAILQSSGKIQMGESTNTEDVIEEFCEIGKRLILKQFTIQSATSNLNEFMDILQLLYEQRQIHEGVNFRFTGDQLLLRMPSIYPIFQQRYRLIHNKLAPDRDTILQEIYKVERERDKKEILKPVRFQNPANTSEAYEQTASNSLSITYKIYSDKYGLDLNNRIE